MRKRTVISAVTCCWLALSSVTGRTAPAELDPVTEAFRFFEALIAGDDGTRILPNLRPAPISEPDRAEALASVPTESVLVPDAKERTKLKALEAILIYHERQQVIEIKLIDVPMAVVGLHRRSAVLISRPALTLLSETELQATVAHEMGHEYFWRDDVGALRGRHDMRSLRVLELKCDGVAVLTLLALGLNPGHLHRAIEKMAMYNEVANERWGTNGYPHPSDRKRFVDALLDLIHKNDMSRLRVIG